MSLGSRCHPPCRSVRTFTVNSPRLSGFTTDSPALESAVISRYRPRAPSVATGLLSMDMLPMATAFRSTSSGHQSPSLELSLGRSAPSLEMSYCGVFIGRRWYTPSFWHTEQKGKFTERQPFTSGTDFGAFRALDPSCVAKRQTVLASHPNNQRMDTLRLGWSSLQGIAPSRAVFPYPFQPSEVAPIRGPHTGASTVTPQSSGPNREKQEHTETTRQRAMWMTRQTLSLATLSQTFMRVSSDPKNKRD